MKQKLKISSKKCYNNRGKQCLTETILPVYFASDDKRAKQTTNNRRRREPYTLWRNLSNSTVLQKTANQETSAKKINIPAAFWSLSSNGPNYSNYLCHNSWDKPIKQDKDTATKRCISENSRDQKLPVRKQPAKISETLRSKDCGWYQQNSRPVAVENVLSSASPYKHPIRFRFNSSNNLRQTDRRSQSWLQSRQKGKAFLSSIGLLRVLHQRLLAWGSKTGRRLYRCWCSGILARVSPKSSALYLPYQSTCGFRILRPQVYRAFRREKCRLCHSSETDRWHKEKTSWSTLSPVQERLVSCRISVYANEMEESPSLYCDSQETSEQAARTADLVYPGTVFLPNICYQSSIGGSQYLVFLQRPSYYRNTYQRTQTRFLFNQDTNEQFFGKSNLFYFALAGLQYSQLVQTSLPAGAIEKLNIGHNPYRDFSVSSKTDKTWEQECPQTSSSPVSVTPTPELHNPENREIKDQVNIMSLLNSQYAVPSKRYK